MKRPKLSSIDTLLSTGQDFSLTESQYLKSAGHRDVCDKIILIAMRNIVWFFQKNGNSEGENL